MEIVEIAEDRYQVIDARGRLVVGYPTKVEAEAFVRGYTEGRTDGANVASVAVDGLSHRIAGKT